MGAGGIMIPLLFGVQRFVAVSEGLGVRSSASGNGRHAPMGFRRIEPFRTLLCLQDLV